MRHWRARHGPDQEVVFAQVHPPGRLGLSDFTAASDLGIIVAGAPLVHLPYHFPAVLLGFEHAAVVVEHQSTPRRWMALRVLNYCLHIWARWLRAHKDEKLPLIVPVVFYQGRDPWWPEREFRELVEGALAEWRWVPRFEYLLVDQTLRG